MKNFILFMTLALSFNLYSQVRTGGGGILDEAYMETIKTPAERFEVLNNYLKKADLLCSTGHIENSKSIMDSYYTLNLYKLNLLEEKGCEVQDGFLTCLNDKTTQLIVKHVVKNKKESVEYLKTTYKINDSSAEKIIKFFHNLDRPYNDSDGNYKKEN